LRPLVLSQLCIATSIGTGLDATLTALRSGTSGLRPCRFETVEVPTHVGQVAAVDAVVPRDTPARLACRNNRLARLALATDGFSEAIAAAKDKYGPHRIGVFLGTSTSGILESELAYRARDVAGALPPDFDYAGTHNTYSVAAFVMRELGLAGPASVVSCACASTAKAFVTAARMIAAGACDAAIVGGADSLCLTTLYGFHSLALTAAGPCRPFDAARDGISIGEGAGFVLLEAIDRHDGGDRVLLLGAGESSDAYHMSTPHPEALGARLAMERALAAAQLAPRDIDYVNLHGTATRVGDAAEDIAIADLFGETQCSSTKGQTGHTLGAAGVVEAIICALAIRHGFAPGTTNTQEIDGSFRCCYLLRPEPVRLDRVLSNSFGFGGSNCSLVLGRA
jgi:3-oxoacyl-[acyl-carrier-protein] synthase-1